MNRHTLGTIARWLAVPAVLLLFAGTAGAGPVVFADNFDQESLGLNYVNFQHWTVTAGSVDVVGTGFYQFLCDGGPSPARCVDLDGSTSSAGTLQSEAITLAPSQYELRFWLRGNDRGAPPDTLRVTLALGALYAETFVYGSDVPWTEIVRTFTYGGPGENVALVFSLAGGDNQGMILDNVQLQAVPEPATLTLLGLGLAGVARVARRRRE